MFVESLRNLVESIKNLSGIGKSGRRDKSSLLSKAWRTHATQFGEKIRRNDLVARDCSETPTSGRDLLTRVAC